MKFTLAKLDVVAVQTLSPPIFTLPARAPEVFEGLYGQLNERFSMRAGDFRITGGTSYSDVKLTVKSENTMQVDLGPVGFYAHIVNLQDREHFKGLVSVVEDTLKAFFPKTTFVDSLIKLHGWLAVEGGTPVVEAALQERGEKALGLKSFEEFSKEYTLRTEMKRKDGTLSIELLMEKSKVEKTDLYAEAKLQFNSTYQEKRLAVQFDTAMEQAELMLKDLGFEGVKK